jgi:hypothetical protein
VSEAIQMEKLWGEEAALSLAHGWFNPVDPDRGARRMGVRGRAETT